MGGPSTDAPVYIQPRVLCDGPVSQKRLAHRPSGPRGRRQRRRYSGQRAGDRSDGVACPNRATSVAKMSPVAVCDGEKADAVKIKLVLQQKVKHDMKTVRWQVDCYFADLRCQYGRSELKPRREAVECKELVPTGGESQRDRSSLVILFSLFPCAW